MNTAVTIAEGTALRSAPRIPTIARIRFQLLGGILVPTALALALRGLWSEPQVTNATIVNSVAGVAVAILLGYFALRKIASFPGTHSLRYVVPVFVAAFLGVIALFFLFRLDYSRFQFFTSALLAMGWFVVVLAASKGSIRQTFAVIPVGDAASISSLGGVDWRVLNDPARPLHGVDGVVVDLRADHSPEWQRFIADCVLNCIPVYHVKQVRESLTGRLEIQHLSENTLGSLNPNDIYMKSKRLLDATGAAVCLVLGAPLLLLIGVLVRIDSPGPALFRQVRVGRGGRPFVLYKFRSMAHAPQEATEDSLAAACTLPGDRRVTRFGRFLRTSRLDELPQIINILRGEMSWIGPRPEAVPLSQWYQGELPFYYYRHIVYPGITGWAQVNQGHVTEVDHVLEKLHYDFYYIKNFSAWLDILILMKTVRTMLTGFGAR